MKLDRGPLLADRSITGSAWCSRHTQAVDRWLGALFDDASQSRSGVALVAIGGYGRSELCPASDIDLMLVHDSRVEAADIAQRIWYPIWDQGIKLGHSLCTARQALRIASDDLDTATALLSCRRVAGDEQLVIELAERALAQWRDDARRWLPELYERVVTRHAGAGEVAFLLEPDVKEGRGGMRDVHSLRWAELARPVLFANDDESLDAAYTVLLDTRVELQRTTGRALNVLTQQDQPVVAAALGDTSDEALMARVAQAARAIAWMSDDTWRRIDAALHGRRSRGRRRDRVLVPGVVEHDGEVRAAGPDDHGLLVTLRVASAAAEHNLPIARLTLDFLRDNWQEAPPVWPADARALLERLLLAGRPAVAVIEALDHHGIWQQILPEWTNVRSRPQHNPYHRFTVDRHLLEAVANASALAPSVDRPELLVMAALLHDLGKGTPRDHTELGVELASRVGARVGYPPADVEVLEQLVRHHLLLGDVASRRDLDEMATIDVVADAVGTVSQLRLLAALTEADAKATGPTAWGSWRAGLVQTLVVRVAARLGGEAVPLDASARWRDSDDLADLARGGPQIVAGDGTVTIVTRDRLGVFSRVAGVLSLRGLDVLEAVAYSSEDGVAVSRFRVTDRFRDVTPWEAISADLSRALDGRLAIEARLADRARTHARNRRAPRVDRAVVRFDNEASNDATVVDVEAPDAIGVLYRITRALSDLDLDIRSAKVQTLGAHVVDAFYVQDRAGGKVEDDALLAEIERSIVHAVTQSITAAHT